MSRKRLKNSKPSKGTLQIQCSATGTPQEEGPPSMTFSGYSGGAVNLSDYGFDAPVYYNVSGIKTKQKIPILYEHSTPIGHTTRIVKTENNSAIKGKGIASFPGETTAAVTEAIKNQFPFEASMGLTVDDFSNKNIVYINEKETRVVNNRSVTGPAYEIKHSTLREMTVTPFGRDSDTSFEALNKEQLMLIKNSTGGPVTESTPAPAPAPAPIAAPAPTPAPIQNAAPIQGPNIFKMARLLNKYPGYEEAIEQGFEANLSVEQIENSIKLDLYEKNLPKVPNTPQKDTGSLANSLAARIALAVGIRPETVEKKLGKEVTGRAFDLQQISLVESLVHMANAMGGDFNGHSDIENMCKFIQKHNLSGYSTFDMPNLFLQVTEIQLEERWALNPPFAPQHLKEESNRDFRPTRRIRPGGGEVWGGFNADGKIDHTTFGKETVYESELDTVAQLLVLNRETIINDDMGVVSELLDAMVEGALAVPDIKLGRKMLAQAAAANTFWVNADNSFTSTALNRTNLSARYNAVRQYNEDRGGKQFVNMINDRWKLITSITQEETAWELIKQDKIIQETGAANPSKTGEKNYWFGRMDLAVFPQMSNTSLFSSGTFISENTWLLWPSSARYAPYSITYLRGQRRPTVETVTLPADMLGFGVRGYWDVEINERERLAVVRCNG